MSGLWVVAAAAPVRPATCLAAAPGVKIVALADAFASIVSPACRERLATQHPDTANVAADHCFVGLDAYQQLLKTDVNYVILATPPGLPRDTHRCVDSRRQEHLRGKARRG